MKAFEHHHLAACEAANAHHAGQTKIVEVMGCKWAISTVDVTKNGNEWGPPRLTLEPVIGVPDSIAERVRRGLAAIGGLQFVSPTVAFADDQLTDDRAAEVVAANRRFLVDLESDELTNIMAEASARSKKTAPTWDGEGLPPVGVTCEFVRLDDCQKETLQDRTPVTIIAHYKSISGIKVAAFTYDYEGGRDVESAVGECFRPICTAEQTAAAEREKAIERLCKVVMADPRYADYNLNIDCSCAMRLAVEAIYDNRVFAADDA